ncbi:MULTISPECIES: molybdopterin-dependent oxidoreductase [Pseudodesulfovibrio]|uniref:Trimethylamine-N-oxide reductase (Cytochrome c) n=1 Tax=Pseudodesulfovibrio aespoeensis (strain ATCC 700646 / DSM 10631 / Aspo-2) TaxID=643562 RepID=E6VTI3_PSEA9|nr:molybdopterin-dependent oxidoreductase [Pseudodesulfovibrio aespoeensis]ADU62160.1 Trimethylamine-N-oxide reductase (cytochrome c) [Pseudodesulfovibrio aespoeensis Aspo-2]
MKMGKQRIITTCTRDCPNACGLVASVEDGRLVRLVGDPDHPLTNGIACHKTVKYIDRVYSPERITHPMLRRHGRWERATWNEALDLIAKRIRRIVEESGPEAILYYQGYGERTALKLLHRYFFNLLGGVTTLRGSLCGGAGQGAQNLDFGERVSHDPLDHRNSRSMVLWARNPASTNISLVPIIRDIRKRGGSVIVIDPAHTRSAALADHHIRPKPGHDGYLAMAAAKLILSAGAEDREFINHFSEGYEQFRAILDRHGVAELCAMAGVSTADAVILANTLMAQKPTSILLGWGLHRYENAHHLIRAVDALGAVSGNIGVAGGGVSQGFEEYGPFDQHYWGDTLNPPRRTLLIARVGEELLNATDPKIRMIFVTAANPLCMAPNTAKVTEAFDSAEFVVYSGHFMDDTADHAQVFLPATTFLEEDDVTASYGHNYVGPVNRVIEPVGECRSEFRMFHELAARFPFADRFRRSEEEWLHDLCAPIWAMGCDLPALRRGAFRLDAPMVPYVDKNFPTPSGKFRFMNEFTPSELPRHDPEFPYRLLTIAPHGSICSERTMADHAPLPEIVLNTGEAAENGMIDNDLVLVRSPVGQVRARLKVDPDQRPDVAVAERGGWTKAGHGLNLLTRDMVSAVGQGTPFYETAVAITPCPQEGVMGARILVVRHSPHAPGGVFCKELERLGAILTTVSPLEGDALPQTPDGHEGLVVLGGPQHAFDDEASPHFVPLMRLMREFDAAGRPVAGICLGCQLLARAYGGRTWTMDGLEFGFITHRATTAGMADRVIGSVLPLPPLMEFHEDSFDLPEGAELLVAGDSCVNQCFRVGSNAYGFQFHLEVDSRIADHWITGFRNGEFGNYAVYAEQFGEEFFVAIRERLPVLVAESEAWCRKVVAAWAAAL